MFGPIFILRTFGMVCPCMESEENKGARKALQELNAMCRVVDWHAGKKKGARGFVQSLFKNASSSDMPTPSKMQLVDGRRDEINNGDSYPELQIKPLASFGDKSSKTKKGADIRIDIPLHHICKIEEEDESTIVICTKDVHSADETAGTTKEAARITLPSQDDRNSVSLDLKVLVEWNKNRQPEIEEEFAADGIRAKAKKAAHFAKRQIEMKEIKKSREKRKQKYLQGGSGMKFTAVAMANRET